MATMIPRDIGEFETEGEKAFYKFLEGVAKPDAHYLCWYLPEINGKEPDRGSRPASISHSDQRKD